MSESATKYGWRSMSFGELAENVNVRVEDPRAAGVKYYVGLEHLDSDSLKIRRWGVPSDVAAAKLGFRAGDIIFGRRRAYQRKLAVAEFDGICSAHALVLRARSGVIDKNFFPFFMQSDVFMERAKTISVGSLSPTINWKTLARQRFSLPPIEEQCRYARLLGQVDELACSLKRAEEMARTVLASMRESHFVGLCHALPACRAPIGSVAPIVTKGESPRWQGFEYVEQGTRFITSENVLDGVLSLDPAKFVPSQFGVKLARSRLSPGDILINIVGGSIGRVCIVPDGLGDANVNQAVALVRPNQDLVHSEYLLSCLLSRTVSHELCSRSVDDYKPNLSLSTIREFRVPVPPMSTQVEHVEQVRTLERSIAELHRRVADTISLKRTAVQECVA